MLAHLTNCQLLSRTSPFKFYSSTAAIVSCLKLHCKVKLWKTTCSGPKGCRLMPLCPCCPPWPREPVGGLGLVGLTISLDGGLEELEEFLESLAICSLSLTTKSVRLATCALRSATSFSKAEFSASSSAVRLLYVFLSGSVPSSSPLCFVTKNIIEQVRASGWNKKTEKHKKNVLWEI